MVIISVQGTGSQKQVLIDTKNGVVHGNHSAQNKILHEHHFTIVDESNVDQPIETARDALAALLTQDNGNGTLNTGVSKQAVHHTAPSVDPDPDTAEDTEPIFGKTEKQQEDETQLLKEFDVLMKEKKYKAANPIALYIAEAGATPLLSREQEIALTKTIEEQRTSWRAEILESPYMQQQLIAEYMQVCRGEKSVFSYSKLVKRANKADVEKGNTAEAVLEKMRKNAPQLQQLLDVQKEHIRQFATQMQNSEPVDAPEYFENLSREIRMLLEQNPVKDEWFLPNTEQDRESPQAFLVKLSTEMQNIETSDEAAMLIVQAGETQESLTERLDRASVLYTQWQSAKTQLVAANLRLVISIAKRHRNRNLSFLDVIQEGNIGLMMAADKYDLDYECRFATFATWWIRQAINRALAKRERSIYLPEHRLRQLYNMRQFVSTFESDNNGRKPTKLEIATHLEVDLETVVFLQGVPSPISLDQQFGEYEETSFGSLLEDKKSENPFNAAITADQRTIILEGLAELTPREREVLCMRSGLRCIEQDDEDGLPIVHLALDDEEYGMNLTLKEVGEALSITKERVRQIQDKAIKKLLKAVPKLREYVMETVELEEHIENHVPSARKKPSADRRLDVALGAMLSIRIANALAEQGKHTVGDLIGMTYQELSRIPDFGSTRIDTIDEMLKSLGLDGVSK